MLQTLNPTLMRLFLQAQQEQAPVPPITPMRDPFAPPQPTHDAMGLPIRPSTNERRQDAWDQLVSRSLHTGPASVGPDTRSFFERNIAAPLSRTPVGQALGRLAGRSGHTVRDYLGADEHTIARAEQSLVNTLGRGTAHVIDRLDRTEDGSPAGDAARRYLEVTDPATSPNRPLPPADTPLEKAVEGAGSMAPALLTGSLAAQRGYAGVKLLMSTMAGAYPGVYGESVESLREAGVPEGTIDAVAPIVATAKAAMESMFPARAGARITAGPATRRVTTTVGMRVAQVLATAQAEGTEEGIAETGQAIADMVAAALLTDNPQLTRENAQELGENYAAGYWTGLVVSGGSQTAPGAAQAFGSTLRQVFTDQSGQILPEPDAEAEAAATAFDETHVDAYDHSGSKFSKVQTEPDDEGVGVNFSFDVDGVPVEGYAVGDEVALNEIGTIGQIGGLEPPSRLGMPAVREIFRRAARLFPNASFITGYRYGTTGGEVGRPVQFDANRLRGEADATPYDEAEAREHFDKFDESQSNVSWEEVQEVLPEILADESVFDKPIDQRNAEDAIARGEQPRTRTQTAVAEAIDRISRRKGEELRAADELERRVPVMPESIEERSQVRPDITDDSAREFLHHGDTRALHPITYQRVHPERQSQAPSTVGPLDSQLNDLRTNAPRRHRAVVEALAEATQLRRQAEATDATVRAEAIASGNLGNMPGRRAEGLEQRARALLRNEAPAGETTPPAPMTPEQRKEAVHSQPLATQEAVAEAISELGISGPDAAHVGGVARNYQPDRPVTTGASAAGTHNGKPLDGRGSTIDPATGRPVSPSRGRYVVSPYKSMEMTAPGVEVDPALWEAYARYHDRQLQEPVHFVGTWTPDPETEPGYTGRTVYDVVRAENDPRAAASIARAAKQEAVYDAQTGETLTPDELEARADALDAARASSGVVPAAGVSPAPGQSVGELGFGEGLGRSTAALDAVLDDLGIPTSVRQTNDLERSDLKRSVVTRIGNRMVQILRDRGDDVDHNGLISNNHPIAAAGPIDMHVLADKFIGAWAGTAGSNNPNSYALQLAAEELFGLGARTDHFDTEGRRLEIARERVPAAKLFLEAAHAETQERLAAAGFGPDDAVPLLRGMEFRDSGSSASTYGQGDFTHLQPLNSFSSLGGIALSFSGRGGDSGVILFSAVPRRNIIGSTVSGCGCLVEGEYIVAGGRYSPDVVRDVLMDDNVRERLRQYTIEALDASPEAREALLASLPEFFGAGGLSDNGGVVLTSGGFRVDRFSRLLRLLDVAHGGTSWAADADILERLAPTRGGSAVANAGVLEMFGDADAIVGVLEDAPVQLATSEILALMKHPPAFGSTDSITMSILIIDAQRQGVLGDTHLTETALDRLLKEDIRESSLTDAEAESEALDRVAARRQQEENE